jgi:hypothetical protein
VLEFVELRDMAQSKEVKAIAAKHHPLADAFKS